MFRLILLFTGLALMSIMPAVGAYEDPDTLPLLPQERHVGAMFYGWGAPPPVEMQPRIDEATAAGMNAYSVYLDWPELEPAPGSYDFSDLRDTLTWASENGLSTFANITVIDIESLVVPPEFLIAGSVDTLATEAGFDDPELVERFLALLDEVTPLLVEHGVFYLGVGNEVDAWLNNQPADRVQAYLDFIATARAHVHKRAPELAVGVTVTGFVPLDDPDMLDTLYEVADVISANIYGIDAMTFTITNREDTIALVENFLAAFDGRPVIIPELGCASAESMQSSLADQQECFETMFDVLTEYPNVRFVTVFTFHDFDDFTCGLIQAVFGFDDKEDFETVYDERIADYLCTLGLVNADGSPKPAYEAFLAGVEALTVQN